MTTKEFVRNFYNERKYLLESSFDFNATHRSAVSQQIEALGLSDQQMEQLRSVISTLLTDTFYTFLLGLDGAANIGGHHETYKVYSEDGSLISECGELEAEAYNYFIADR